MAKRGAKGKYTPELVNDIIALLETGSTDVDAYSTVGISHETFYTWLEQKPEFSEAVSRAYAQARRDAIGSIRTALTDRIVEDETEEIIEEPLWDSKARKWVTDEYGNPVIITRKKITRTKKLIASDWRAGESYLKRRDAKYWSERLQTAVSFESGDEPITPDDIRKAFEEVRKWAGSDDGA